MHIVVAPDSFKSSLSSADAARAIAAGLRAAWAHDATPARIDLLPFADGGEGTLETIASAWGTRLHEVDTTDALGRPVAARFALSPDGTTGLVEAAAANGLPLVSDVPLQALAATSFGVGKIIRAVLDAGAQEILLFLGGSASTDGGAGILQALGALLLDAEGAPLPHGGGSLSRLDRIDLSGLDPRAGAVRWRIACDVTNPLVGPQGSSAVFGPQKGADASEVAVLDDGLRRLATVLTEHTGVDTAELRGAGAAGGIPAPLVALFGAELEPGVQVVAEAIGAAEPLAAAEVVVTGEGRLDAQSLGGKVVSGLRGLIRPDATLVVIAGEVDLSPEQLETAGITAAFSLAPGPRTLAQLQGRTAEELERVAYSVGRLLRR